MVVLALRGEFVPFAVNLAASEANATVAPFLPLAERLGRLFTGLAGGVPETLELSYEGQIADYDCKVLTLAAMKGVLAPVVDEPVSFVNAPAIAEARGLVVRESKVAATRDYVNLVELRGVCGGRETHVAGTLYGKQGTPRIVGIDDHVIDVPPSAHMVVVRNQDVPGVIGTVATIIGDAKVNIDDMVVGRTPSGAAALMALATTVPVGAEVIAALRAADNILDARAIEL
jgi:D-3-phosphoglycerate dehydrogenase